MEEIILVTGCDRTRSWTNLAFFENEHNARATFGSKVVHSPAISIEWQSSPENIQGVVLHRGPDGTNLPEDQCVFIRGFRVARTFRILPKHLKAAAGPSSDPDGYDCEPDLEVVSIPATSKYRDPLQILLDYIAERAPDCDMFLIHDDDLKRIDGIGNGTSPEALQPDVMMDLLRRPNIEIHTVPCDSPHINSNSSSNTEVVRVAMFLTQEWSIAPQSQLSSLAAQSTGLHHASESSVLPTKTGHANEALSTLKNLGRSHPIHRPEHAIQRPSLHSAFPSPPHTTSKRVVKLIVISDFACPWCFIAHRELQDAIAQCSNLPISFVVEYRPFLLHTTAPTEPIDKNEFVGRKIGRERWEAYKLMATERGEAVGINFSFAGPVSLTTPAHRLMTKAYEIGGPAAQSSLITPIFRASYEDDLDISDPDVLADLAEQAPIMSRAEALSFIKSEECLATVNHQVSEARAKGVTGVPFTIIDRKWAISGGQSAPVFVAIFSKLAEAAGSPSSQLSTSPTGLLQQVPCFT
ncbi:thioredoxin-like protein [Russula ochroleuca]|uniref:Thioredoxin-like protein n=1 Tax=Russula ochroleuca TaxID=152965 RepID=A0A9P5MSS7_9AGAM|nr:thioredoxin-like protein [Russula ochroleuca]